MQPSYTLVDPSSLASFFVQKTMLSLAFRFINDLALSLRYLFPCYWNRIKSGLNFSSLTFFSFTGYPVFWSVSRAQYKPQPSPWQQVVIQNLFKMARCWTPKQTPKWIMFRRQGPTLRLETQVKKFFRLKTIKCLSFYLKESIS